VRDLTPADQDAPTWRLREPGDYAFAPDSRGVVYSTKKARNEAWSTNSDLWLVPVGGGAAKRLTENPGDDATPRFSPDSKLLAWRAQVRPGYESDRFRPMVMSWPGGRPRELAAGWDRSLGELTFSKDSKSLVAAVEEREQSVLYSIPVDGGAPQKVSGSDLSI